MRSAKAPLTPKWAVILSVVAVGGALVLAVVFRLVFGVSLARVLGFVAGAFVGLSWAALDKRSYRVGLWATEGFLVFVAVLLSVLVIVQDDYEPVPGWANVLAVVAGVVCCAVVSACGIRNFVRWLRGEFDGRGRATARPAKPGEVYLVSRNLETATAEDVARAEEQLGCAFPPGYRKYVTTLGLGTYTGLIEIFMPEKIVGELPEWRQRLEEYYFWDEGADVLAKDEVLRCVILGHTLNGDELMFHPERPDVIYVLPRDDERIHPAGATLDEAIEWLCTSRVLTDEVLDFRYFESWKDREKMTLYGRVDYREFKESILSAGLHDHVAIDSKEEGCLVVFYSDFYGSLHWSGPDGPGGNSVIIEYDRHKRSEVLAALTGHLVAMGFKDVPVDHVAGS